MERHLLLVSLMVIITISSAIQTFVPLTIPDNHEVHAKKFGKTIKRDVLTKGQTSPHFSQHDGIVESSKDFLKTYPLTGKNFQKAAVQPSNKSKKRACFWKYCVQSK